MLRHVNENQIWLGLLVLRGSVGATMIAHGYNHIYRGGKIKGTAGWFASLGMKPGILHAWLASITELAAGLGLVVGLLTPLAAGAIFGVLAVAFDHQPPQGRVLRVPPPDRGLGVPDEPARGVRRDRVRRARQLVARQRGRLPPGRLVGPRDHARDRLRRHGRAARGVLASAGPRARRPEARATAARMIELEHVAKIFPGPAVARGRRPEPRRARGRDRGAHRAVGLRQVDDAADDQPARSSRHRDASRSRARTSPRRSRTSCGSRSAT